MAHGNDSRTDERLAELARTVTRNSGVEDERILQAFRAVPRQEFVPESSIARAFEDVPLPIGEGQTISQPSMIAVMLRELAVQAGARVLEIGAGSGYAAALLARLAGEVHGVERNARLVARARENLARLGVTGVTIHEADGTFGLPELAPFSHILVSAFAPRVPDALFAQLAPGGRLVMPIGKHDAQVLTTHVRDARGALQVTTSTPCIFVPLVSPASGSF